MLRSTKMLAILFAAFTLILGACGDDDDAADAGTPTPDAQADQTVTPDAVPDTPAEDVVEDAVAEVAEEVIEDVVEEIVATNFCVNADDGPLLADSEATCVEFVMDGGVPIGYTIGECAEITDDSEYLVDWLGDAVGHCAASSPTVNPHTCIGCLTGPATCFPASETDPGEYDLTACVLECIALSADDATMPPIHDAVIDSGLSEDCAGCFASITACILGNNCAGACLADSESVACLECSCGCTDTDLGRSCPNEFALCSGVDPYVDCDVLPSCSE